MTFSTIQLLRFIAAFLVLLFHLRLLDSGYKGVDIFFVISGYVMYLNLFILSRPKFGKFFINRFTKIYFLYWVALFFFYFVKPFSFTTSLFWNSLFLVPGKKLILGLGWTLSYELYFYILIGTIAYLLSDKYAKITLLIVLILSSIVTFLSLFSHFQIAGTTFLLGKYTWEFLLGILSGFLSGKIPNAVKTSILLSIAIIVLILLLTINISRETISLLSVIYGLLSMLLICFVTACERRISMPPAITKPFKILGDASYAIYLFGPHIVLLISGFSFFPNAIIIAVTIMTGIFLNRIIEVNGLQWCRNILNRLT